MSYIKIELGGKERGLKFNQLALEEMTKLFNSDSATSNIYAMFWGGLKGNSFVKREEPDYSFEEVCDWVDEIYATKRLDVIIEVEKALVETQLYKSLLEVEDKEEKKSKLKKIV